MRIFLIILGLALLAPVTRSAEPEGATDKARIRLAADGFPTGRETPEGAACDLARAFITRDATLFTNVCVRSSPGAPAEYDRFLQNTAAVIRKEAGKKRPSKRGPKAIGKVFLARSMASGKSRPSLAFQQLKFVDVGLILEDGSRSVRRTLVLCDQNGRWLAHPAPQVSPELAPGLNQEPPSKQDYSSAYASAP